jgi:cytoskeletal protein RodZ
MDSVGNYLRGARVARGMSIEEVARATRIPLTTVEHIEADRFDDLPGEVFTRGFLRAFARAVLVPVDDVLARYSASRRISEVTALPLSSPSQKRSSGRRFGVAIAFVLLLILFTLGLSVILKPRGREAPKELSRAPVATADLVRLG